MVLQSETFPVGYQQQSYSQDGYYPTGYGHGPNMYMAPIPSLSSPHVMPSSGYGPHHHYQPRWHDTSTDYYYSHGSNGRLSSSFHGSNGHMPSLFLVTAVSAMECQPADLGVLSMGQHTVPWDPKVEPMKHEYSSYGNGRPSIFHNHMHGGHQSAEWTLKSIEDDD